MNRAAMLPASYQFDQLAKDLHRMGAVERRRLRVEFSRIGQSALSDARSRAGAWSSRIPSAISTRPITDMVRSRVGVELRVSKSVPHARAFEGITQPEAGGYFRHPVYGRTGTWVRQPTRPFLAPAARGRAADAQRAVQQVFEDAARECGFR